MPTFDTLEPISATLDLQIGSVRITASKRTDTVVEVLPSNGAEDADVRAAQQTTVTYAGGTLQVKGPRKRSLFGRAGSLDVSIELPAGSEIHAIVALGDLTCQGPLGDCRLKTSVGDIQVDQAQTVHLRTDHGDIQVHHAAGNAELIGAGRITAGSLAGTATVKNGNGETVIGEVVGDLRANAANGRISVDVARSAVEAKSANGAIRVGEVTRGRVTLQAAVGDVEVGIAASTAAWLDVHTRVGTVRNALGPSEGPGTSDETVEVRASTGVGDIVISRS
ncbi:DUF4097 family beta strand repeat-containing protein [Streptomyces sp. H10-C2]|uniref:DUF4097 family beta strand repeat-containing protein n=1 Tax=unclassified Streptomyces TaxID=2593676 RepID=UPI0024BBC90B|nr:MULTISPECIES: DUF4097 family beta strand repeat-containing protein [unclassified Streptomyces]MDJ0345155.1 DUF4097 family beta strand repeat-containing protein [Streptomyces sp. PH10-H1]MDJ0374123.1 DUF4097 family beta strand repeat-containing protein [Streptomyces sp. H10-C2]